MPLSPTWTVSRDHSVETPNRGFLDFEVALELFGHGLADVDLFQARRVWNTFEMEDAVDQLLGMVHLAHRFLADLVRQTIIAPVAAHHRVDEVVLTENLTRVVMV